MSAPARPTLAFIPFALIAAVATADARADVLPEAQEAEGAEAREPATAEEPGDAGRSEAAEGAPSDVIVILGRALERDSPVPFSNLSRRALEEEGAFKDIPTLLSELPSTLWYSENGNGIGYNYLSIRGFDQRRISVLVDGVPQNDPEDHNVYWVNFYDLGGSLEDVQVQRGGGAAFYGPPAIGGAVNLVTRRFSEAPFSRFEVGEGFFDPRRYDGPLVSAHRATAEAGSGQVGAALFGEDKLSFYARFSYLESEGYRDWSWSRYWRGFLGAEIEGARSSLRLQAYGGPQSDALAYYGIPKAYNSDPEPRRTNWGSGTDVELFNQTHYDAVHEWNPTASFTLRNSLFYLRGSGYFDFAGYWGDPGYFRFSEGLPAGLAQLYEAPEDDPEGAPAETIPGDTIIRAQVTNNHVGWLPQAVIRHSRGEHILGGELRMHRSDHWGRIQSGSFPEEVAALIVGEEGDHRFYAYRGAKDVASLYLGERLRATDALTVHANLQGVAQRYRVYDEAWVGTEFSVPYLFLNPRIGLNYNVNPWLNAYAGVSRTRREPRLKNLYDADEASWGVTPAFEADGSGAPDYSAPLVVPETLVDWELGLGAEGGRARGRAGAFVMDFRDEIVPSGGVDIYGQPRTANADRSVHAGLELEGAVSLGAGFEVSANTSLSRNRFDSLGGALGGGGLAGRGEVGFVEYCEDDSVSEAVPVDRTGGAIAGFPDLMANARLSWRRGGARAALSGRLVGRHYTDNSMDTRCDGTPAGGAKVVDPYVVTGLTAGIDLPIEGLTLSLDVDNLLNGHQFVGGGGGGVEEVSPYVLMTGIEEDYFPLATRSYYLRLTGGF